MGLEQQWSDMMAGWASQQKAFLDAMTTGVEQAEAKPDLTSFLTGQPLLALYQQFTEAAQRMQSDNMPDWTSPAGVQSMVDQMGKQAQELWESAENLQVLLREAGMEHSALLAQIMSPDAWLRQAGGDMDLGIEKLSEGVSFAGYWDMDKKLSRAQASWVDSRLKSAAYHGVVLKAWVEAFQSFISDLDQWNPSGGDSMRALLDKWLDHANDVLVEMHKSDEFLTAQREMIRAGMQYRLNEKAVAEDICGLLHIPGRKEVDELHLRVTELRREVRRLNKMLSAEQAKNRPAPAAKTAASTKPASKSTTTARKTSTRKTTARKTGTAKGTAK